MFLKNIKNYKVPLDYLHDSKIVDCDKSTNIQLVKFENNSLDTITSFSKINQKVLPFLVYNYFEENLAVKLGQNSLDQDYSDFFKESFTLESKRTGRYTLTESPSPIVPEYTIDISYESCKVDSKYQFNSTHMFLFFTYNRFLFEMYDYDYEEKGFPAQTDLALKVRLNKGSDLVFEKSYSIHKSQPFLINVLMYQRPNFIMNMAESLSLSTKECIEKIIADINEVINKK